MTEVRILCFRGSGQYPKGRELRDMEKRLEQKIDNRELCDRCKRESNDINQDMLCGNCVSDMVGIL